jgi:3D (Asp-Asp-Asp) domain-containing protein
MKPWLAVTAAAMVATPSAMPDGAPQVVSAYVTFYGFDDNDDGNPTHTGTDVISHPTLHQAADEDLGTFDRPGTLAADLNFIAPGTRVYVPALKRYYIMEDTCRPCTKDWKQGKPHVDLYLSGTGAKLAKCEDRLTMESAVIIINPPADLPVQEGPACDH